MPEEVKAKLRGRRISLTPAEQRRNGYLKFKYKITLDDYNRMLAEQRGACAICNATNSGIERYSFVVDHDHRTGKVRSLLCHKCNLMLGYVSDNMDTLKKLLHI